MSFSKIKEYIIKERSLIARLASFMLPIIAFVIASRFGTDKFNESFIRELKFEAERLSELNGLITSANSIIRVSALREILGSGLDPFYLFSLLLGGSSKVLMFGYMIKLGLTGYVMYLLLNQSICVDKLASVVLSLVYAVIPTSLIFGQIVSFQNMLILMPLVALFQDKYLQNNSVKSFIKLIVVEALLFISGVYGFVSGIPFALIFGLLLVLCRSERFRDFLSMLGGIILSILIGAVLSAVVNIPRIHVSPVNSFEGEWTPKYKVYDFLTAFIDGKSPVTGFDTGVVALTLGMFVLLLIILFFINSFIPFKLKIFTVVISVICHLTFAFPVLNSIANVYDGISITASRFVLWAFVLIFVAAISYKNIYTLSSGNVYLGIAILLGIVLISDLSITDVSPTKFTLFFTTGSIIVIGSVLFKAIDKGMRYKYLVCILALSEIVINLVVILPKTIGGYKENWEYNNGIWVEEESSFDLAEVELDILSDEYKYLLLSSDVADYQIQTIPDGINALASASLLPNVFTQVDTEQVYARGINGNERLFTIKDEGQQCELILRLQNPGDGDYYIYSGIIGKVYITETDELSESLAVYDHPSVHRIQSTCDYVNLRIATTPTMDQLAYISVWQLDSIARDSLNNSTYSFDGNVIEGGDFRWMLSHNNSKSLVTSIRYSPMIEVLVEGKKAETFNFLGLLGATLDLDGAGIMPDIIIKAHTTDILIGGVVSVVGIATIISMLYINNKIIMNRNGGEQSCDNPKN